MLSVLFELDGGRFAIDAGIVREILPCIGITAIPQAPAGIAGVCERHGQPVPVVDLCQVLAGRPAERRLSTRIIIVDYADGRGERQHLGLIAERATQLLRHEADAFVASGVRSQDAPYLGEVAAAADGFVQQIDVAALLPHSVRAALFGTRVH